MSLQREMTKSALPPVEPVLPHLPVYSYLPPYPAETQMTTPALNRTPLPESESPHMFSPPLQDISNAVGGLMPRDILETVTHGCRSRRNLAARLAGKLFSLCKRAGSNCRGVLRKNALNSHKVSGIYSVCMEHFPLQCLETRFSAEKGMRNVIDEACRRTKLPVVSAETENRQLASYTSVLHIPVYSCPFYDISLVLFLSFFVAVYYLLLI